MAKITIFLILLSTFIATSWCRNGRFTPLPATGNAFVAFDSVFKAEEAKAKEEQEKTDPKKTWRTWNYPTLKDIDDLYQLENVMTAMAYADGTKAKKVPFGCFLKKGTLTVNIKNKKILGEKVLDETKRGLSPWLAQLKGKTETDVKVASGRNIPFLVNVDSTQKYKLIYVSPGQKITDLPGLEKVKIYLFRHTLFGKDSKEPSKEFARFTPLGVPRMSFDGVKKVLFDVQEAKAMAKQKEEKPKKEWKPWMWPKVRTKANLYLLENAMSATAYADGTKDKGVPFGCFLDKATKIEGDVEKILKVVELKGYTQSVAYKEKADIVPFMVNYPGQKWRVMYVPPKKDLTTIPGLKDLRVYLFRHTKIDYPKVAAAHQMDAGDDYYDDESDYDEGYYDGEYYQNDYYYDDQGGYYYDNGYYEDEDQYYEYNGGNQYGRNGLYRLMRAYQNGLYQN